MSIKIGEARDLVIVELFDLTNKRLWYKNYKLEDFLLVVDDLYETAKVDAGKYLDSLDGNYKPLVNKYRLELKFLVEDKSK